ncbi:MAG: hypothetical protein ACREEX_06325 [Caulobacteraceae bacterium]
MTGGSPAKQVRIAFAVAALASALVLLPVRAWQAHQFVGPYAAAQKAIHHLPVGAVFVDDTGIWYGGNFVRNDPFLRNRPLVFEMRYLSAGQKRELRSRYTVSVFDRADAARYGVPLFSPAR